MAERDPTPSSSSSGDTLWKRLVTRGWEFDFFQAAWLLERHAENRVPVGDRGPVGHEPIRFRPDVSLGFAPTDVRRITEFQDSISDETFHQVDVTFLGLYGVSTPLPLHYAVDILRWVEQAAGPPEDEGHVDAGSAATREPKYGSAPARDFLDIFHHRVISLFYRSWLKYRYDRSFGLPDRNVITDYLLWLIGCPPGCDESVLGVSPIRMLRYAGALTQRPRAAATLEGTLLDYWQEFPVELEQCVGRWVPIAPGDLNRMGAANSTLGGDLTVGEQVYDLSGAFNIAVGPVDWTTYLSFLPDGSRFSQTRALVNLYCMDPLNFTIEIKLRAGEVPEMRLSSDDQASRLGYTSWARTDDIAETSVTFHATFPGHRPGTRGAPTVAPAGTDAPGEMATT